MIRRSVVLKALGARDTGEYRGHNVRVLRLASHHAVPHRSLSARFARGRSAGLEPATSG